MVLKNIILIGFMSFAINIWGQNQHQSNTHAGIKGGYNLAAVTYDGEAETGQRHGFHLGIYGNSAINSLMAIQVEAQYSHQGYQLKDGSGTYTQKLNYINLPVMFQVYPIDEVFLESGAQIGWAISHKETYDSGFNLFDTESDIRPDTFDWGFNFGGGIKIDSGLSFGIRYHLGMGEIYDEGKPKNRMWQFSVGVDF
ncbi:porin family protein [Aureibaculum sp. 2210JD6-5]|uniref:porin family protein n=1 Tax=Aureibaculum sp. 2210JD6-5 TaxID=3103957 RepID=UPI002AAE81F1|nr:porin family protein [Aureibaculum sp. 2210JD6-5]MDY7393857.1 porin family protein [Aureibaculum sp. 2210JD6-5]